MERRQYNRINALLDAEEQVLIENGTQLVPSTLINLGEGGALLALKESGLQFPAGDTFHLFFENGGQLLELNTTVIRSDGQEIAFRFSDLSVEQKKSVQTKIIRMAIISARLRGEHTNSGRHSGGYEIRQTDDGMLVSEEQELTET